MTEDKEAGERQEHLRAIASDSLSWRDGLKVPHQAQLPKWRGYFKWQIELLTFLIAWQDANQVLNEHALTDLLAQLSIGAWLIPIGLLLTLLGGIPLWQGKMKASA